MCIRDRAKPVVAKGDEVKVGMMLAEADGFVSVPVHSSVSGKVSKIDAIVDASGYRRPAIFVDVEEMCIRDRDVHRSG